MGSARPAKEQAPATFGQAKSVGLVFGGRVEEHVPVQAAGGWEEHLTKKQRKALNKQQHLLASNQEGPIAPVLQD